jgi:vancomycin permeability regulator SanA
MFKRIFRSLFKPIMIVFLVAAALMLLPRLVTKVFASSRLYAVEDVETADVAIVFGAQLHRDGSPTSALRDRVLAAVDLYHAGKVNKLLMSGGSPEPLAMQTLALERGVPQEDIILDNSGLRTYDTCYRAKHVYDLEKAILVTQPFHLPRALYLCHFMEIDVQGVPARKGIYWPGSNLVWNLRESLATLVAMWEIHLTKPEPVIT